MFLDAPLGGIGLYEGHVIRGARAPNSPGRSHLHYRPT